MPVPVPEGLRFGALGRAGVPPQDAVAAFARRGLLQPSFRWQDVWQEEHARAFAVAGVSQLDVLKAFQDELDLSLKEGRSLADFSERVRPRLQKAGFWGDVEVTDPSTGELRTTRFDARRLQLIYDVNLRQSHAAGRWARIEANKATHPFVMYRTMNDEHVRASHKPWHGLVLPVDDPFWRTHFPPNGWRCRCTAFSVSERDVQKYAAAGQPIQRQAPPERTVRYENPHTGEVRAVPHGIDPGFAYNPGLTHRDSGAQLLSTAVAAAPARLGAAVWSGTPADARAPLARAFIAWVDEVMAAGVSRNLVQTAGVMQRPEIDFMAALDKEPLSAEIAIEDRLLVGKKVERHQAAGDALSIEEWKSVPRALATEASVYFDQVKNTLLYVFPSLTDGLSIKLAIEVNFKVKKPKSVMNVARSGFRINIQTLADAVRFIKVR